jgi:phosphonate transport system substrate-binding protein
MTINFTVSPSFPNERISDWYIFNTWLQRALSLPIHLELYNSFGAQRAAIAEGKVDLIYANPFDASLLVREKASAPSPAPRARPTRWSSSPAPTARPGRSATCSPARGWPAATTPA